MPDYTLETLTEWMEEVYIPWFDEFGGETAGRGLGDDSGGGPNAPPPPPRP